MDSQADIIKKSYYAIIPANVRYDKGLIPSAKLLYGEVTALCNERGYCWASNNYFAELYGVSKKTISIWINQLKSKEYIKIEMEYKQGSNEILHRYIRICGEGMEEKVNTPMEEKVKENTTYINNTINKYRKGKDITCSKSEQVRKEDKQVEKNKYYAQVAGYFFKGYFALYKEPFVMTPQEGKSIKRLIDALQQIDPDKVIENFIKRYDVFLSMLKNPKSEFMREARMKPSLMLHLFNDLVKAQRKTIYERMAEAEAEAEAKNVNTSA